MTSAILHPFAAPVAEIVGRPGHIVYRPAIRAVFNGKEAEIRFTAANDFWFFKEDARGRAIDEARNIAARLHALDAGVNILVAL